MLYPIQCLHTLTQAGDEQLKGNLSVYLRVLLQITKRNNMEIITLRSAAA